MYPEWLLKDIRKNLGLEADDTSQDDEINAMSKQEVFERYLTWQGIIGYSDRIISVIETIYNIQLD